MHCFFYHSTPTNRVLMHKMLGTNVSMGHFCFSLAIPCYNTHVFICYKISLVPFGNIDRFFQSSMDPHPLYQLLVGFFIRKNDCSWLPHSKMWHFIAIKLIQCQLLETFPQRIASELKRTLIVFALWRLVYFVLR